MTISTRESRVFQSFLYLFLALRLCVRPVNRVFASVPSWRGLTTIFKVTSHSNTHWGGFHLWRPQNVQIIWPFPPLSALGTGLYHEIHATSLTLSTFLGHISPLECGRHIWTPPPLHFPAFFFAFSLLVLICFFTGGRLRICTNCADCACHAAPKCTSHRPVSPSIQQIGYRVVICPRGNLPFIRIFYPITSLPTSYRVPICPRGNLPYFRIFL